jgi:hypothetical protein
MSDKFEMFIKSRLEEGDFPSKAALAAVRAAAERRAAAGVFGVRVRLWGGALLAASVALTLVFSALLGFKGGSSNDCVMVEIIDLFSGYGDDDYEAISDFAHEERLLMWQDAPYEDIAREYAF